MSGEAVLAHGNRNPKRINGNGNRRPRNDPEFFCEEQELDALLKHEDEEGAEAPYFDLMTQQISGAPVPSGTTTGSRNMETKKMCGRPEEEQ